MCLHFFSVWWESCWILRKSHSFLLEEEAEEFASSLRVKGIREVWVHWNSAPHKLHPAKILDVFYLRFWLLYLLAWLRGWGRENNTLPRGRGGAVTGMTKRSEVFSMYQVGWVPYSCSSKGTSFLT